MATRRETVLATLQKLGLTEVEAEMELLQREEEAERILSLAGPADRETAIKQARSVLFAPEVLYVQAKPVIPPVPVAITATATATPARTQYDGAPCPTCGRFVPKGARVCGSCGADIKGPEQARIQKRPVTGADLAVVAGLGAAALGTFLNWASFPDGRTASAWDSEFKSFFFLAASVRAHFALDAIVVLVIAAVGVYGVLMNVGVVPRLPEASSKASGVLSLIVFGIVALPLLKSRGGWWQGTCIVLVCVVELFQIKTFTYTYPAFVLQGAPALGLFVSMAGGAVAAFFGFLHSQQRRD